MRESSCNASKSESLSGVELHLAIVFKESSVSVETASFEEKNVSAQHNEEQDRRGKRM